MRLASDDAEALDLEQQVWTAAVERPPKDARNLRGWLGTVTRNAARNLRRATGRRERHESAVPPPSSQSVRAPDELAAEAEAQRALVRAVLELDEPYRDTVLLRWFEGLPPSEIAARQGVPVATVHTRLARAHARLRERLDREFEGRAVWVPLLIGAGPGAGLLPPRGADRADRPKPVPVPAPLGAPSPLTTTGGLLMAGTLTKTIAAVVVLGIAALLVRWGTSVDGATGDGASDGTDSASADPRVAPSKRKRAAAPQVPDTGDALVGADPDADLVGIVVDTAGAPVRDAELTVVEYPWTRAGLPSEESCLLPRERATTESRDDGTFAFRLRRGDAVNVRARAAGFATAEHVLRSAGERTRIVLDRAVGLDLLCAMPDGTPVAGVRVLALTWPPDRDPRVVRRGVSGADGKLEWSDLPPRVRLHVHPAGWREGPEFDLPAEGRLARTLPFGRGRTVAGTVVDSETGAGIAGALVDVGGPLANLTAAADGTFRLDDWTGRGKDEIHCTAPGYSRGVVRHGDADRVMISLTRGIRIVGRLVAADGKPVAAAFITAAAKIKDDAAPRASSAQSTSDAEGRFVLADLAADLPHRLVVSARGFGRLDRSVEPRPAAGVNASTDLDLGDVVLAAPRTIAGRVVSDGEGIARVTVGLRSAGSGAAASDRQTLRRTDDRGRFRFEDLAPGRYVVASWGDGGPTAERTIELTPTADILDLVLGDASGAGTRMLVVNVLDGDGRPVEGASVTASSARTPAVHAKTTAAGTARIETARRRLMIQASAPKSSLAWLPLAPESRTYADAAATEVTVRLLVGAWTEGTLLRADGTPQPGAYVNTLTADGRWASGSTDPEGRFRLAVPTGGPVRITWTGQVQVRTARGGYDFEDSREVAELTGVAPGTTGLVLQARNIEEGLALRVRVLLPDGSPAAGVGVWARDMALNNPKMPEAKTDAEGRAVLAGLPGRRHRLGTGVTGRLSPAVWTEATPGGPDEVVLSLRESREIRGTITDADGRPFTHYESGGQRARVSPWARDESGAGQSWSTSAGVETDGTFSILVPADEPGPFTVEFNLAPQGSGAEMTQIGCAEKGVLPGATDVHLVMRPLNFDE